MKEITGIIKKYMSEIGRPLRLMEVCGTHTVAIFRHGIRDLLPGGLMLLSGPGCPVCVTSMKDVDTAVELSGREEVILTTFGDMMRVPGSKKALFDAKAEGGDIRIVYSPLDALAIAQNNREKKVVFFSTGFETTAPSVAATVIEADRQRIENFYIYPVHKTVPPALEALLASEDVKVDGFILPGHVCTVTGTLPYEFVASRYLKPAVVTGFGAVDILSGIAMILQQISARRAAVEIQYSKVVKKEGNPKAMAVMGECFEAEDAEWRGIGLIPGSGLGLREKYRSRDIRSVCAVDVRPASEPKACSCGEVLRGIKVPTDCALFGKVCTPEKPVGACMVSSEGSCAAYYKYRSAVNPKGNCEG
jgi:hydrogenase expression/formation protein HypD